MEFAQREMMRVKMTRLEKKSISEHFLFSISGIHRVFLGSLAFLLSQDGSFSFFLWKLKLILLFISTEYPTIHDPDQERK